MGAADAIAELAPHFGERLSTAAAVLEQHGKDEAWLAPHPPDAVIWPLTTDEVAFVARTCHRLGCPIVPWGVGTSLEGHVMPVRGGITLDFGRVDRVLAVHPDDPAEVAEAMRLSDRLTERTLAMGGTISGEHGIGMGKRKFMEREHGADAWGLMGALKHALDPAGILNPGKLVPGN